MDNKDINNKNIFAKIEFADYIYFGIVILLFLITIFLFFNSTKFVVDNINKIFKSNTQENNQSLDLKRYLQAEKKLNLLGENINNLAIVPTEEEIKKEETIKKIEETLPPIDKKLLKIEIINTSKINGIALLLANNLQKNGWSKATTDSAKTNYKTTTILIKESKKDFTAILRDEVSNYYSPIVTRTNPENSKFDAIIYLVK